MRETDKLYLSRHEVRQLAQCLTTLSRIWGDLECAMVKQTHFVDESKVKSTNSTPLPFNVAAAEHIRKTAYALKALCETISTARHLTPPNYTNVLHSIYWLHDHTIDLALIEDAPDYLDEIRQITERAVKLADRPPSDRVAGMCPNCGAISRVSWEETISTCPNCQFSAPAEVFTRELNTVISRSHVTRDEASNYLKDRRISRRTRNRWLKELSIPYHDSTYYLVSDLDTRVRQYLTSKVTAPIFGDK